MDLEKLYYQIGEQLSTLDFERIWPNFKPLKYALFDNEKCFFDGRYIEKTDAFCANTSIVYEGEQIATWMTTEEIELPILTSKIVHEMFHGYQNQNAWSFQTNELEALFQYEYSAENLCLKLRENELLLGLVDGADEAAYAELLSLRKLRSERFEYEFGYELRAEQIEGTANYVEWQALKQLDEKKAFVLTSQMRAMMTKPERLFPIRISCYYTGALLINALKLHAGPSIQPEPMSLLPLLSDIEPSDGSVPEKDSKFRGVSAAISSFNNESESIIETALERNETVLEGPVELVFLNIYDAKCFNGYLTSTFFLMYRDEDGEKMIHGNFVIKMRDERTIETVYRWK